MWYREPREWWWWVNLVRRADLKLTLIVGGCFAEQVESLLNPGSMGSLAAMNVLQALGGAHAQDPVMSVEGAKEDAIIKEREQVGGPPGEGEFLSLVVMT